MKKLIFVAAIAAALLCLASCDKPLPLEYNVTADAVCNGKVVFGTPIGDFTLQGDAKANYLSTKDTTTFSNAHAPELETVLASPSDFDKKTVKAAVKVANDFNSEWKVKEASGTYQIDVVGYVKEPNTGIIIAINYHWPAQPNL